MTASVCWTFFCSKNCIISEFLHYQRFVKGTRNIFRPINLKMPLCFIGWNVRAKTLEFLFWRDLFVNLKVVVGNCGVLFNNIDLEGKGYVEMTGIDAETSKDIHELISGQGGRYLEAQIQGSKKDSDQGDLVVLGAGDKSLFDECQTCFSAMGRTAFYLGKVGYAAKINSVLQVSWKIKKTKDF